MRYAITIKMLCWV